MATSSHRPHVLIIEDEMVSGFGLQLLLSDLGYRSFAFAGTQFQAIEQASVECPDLVTVDVGLLNGSGLDAIDAILNRCGALPVIYVTGDRLAVSGRPQAVVVEKPFSSVALARAVEAAKAAPSRPAGADQPAGAQRAGTVI